MTGNRTAVVTGLGLATPAGMGVGAIWHRQCDGASTAHQVIAVASTSSGFGGQNAVLVSQTV
jgi:3-oxoacyl-(acyl-carrier-protein) synthase